VESSTDSLRGKLLVASPALADPNFARTVVLITEHNDEGAMGIVLNRPAETRIMEVLPELADVAPDETIFVGGPVQPDAIVLLAEFSDPDAAAWIVVADVGLAAADRELSELADRLLRLGTEPAGGRGRARLLDRRAAASGGALPGRPGRPVERRPRPQGRAVRPDRADARGPLAELTRGKSDRLPSLRAARKPLSRVPGG
jgi:hypothetical protein